MVSSPDVLPLPPGIDPSKASEWHFEADPEAIYVAARKWAVDCGIASAGRDEVRTILLLVDLQRDFCFARGSLYVGGRSGRGAMDDNERLVTFIYRNLSEITATVVTLDSHLPHQIFFPSFWVDGEGREVEAHRQVLAEDVSSGELVPRDDLAAWVANGDVGWLRTQALDYCRRLEESGRYSLYLWPPHCLLGSPGHALAGVVEEARLFHAFARTARADVEVKGRGLLTEHYSVLKPEVVTAHDGGILGSGNDRLVAELFEADRVIVAGQAASHCVRNTLEDLLLLAKTRDPAALERFWVLEDCMSAVTVPDEDSGFAVDFTDEAAGVLERCRAAGMNIMRSDVPMREWT